MAARIPWRAQFLLQQLLLLNRHAGKILLEFHQGEAVIHASGQALQTLARPLPTAAAGQLQTQLQPQQILRLIPGLNRSRLIKSCFDATFDCATATPPCASGCYDCITDCIETSDDAGTFSACNSALL